MAVLRPGVGWQLHTWTPLKNVHCMQEKGEQGALAVCALYKRCAGQSFTFEVDIKGLHQGMKGAVR